MSAPARPPRLTRRESKDLTRRRLLDAARVVFQREGFHAATVDAVAEEAGYTKGALYSAFSSKADLFLALYEERIAQRAEDVVGRSHTTRAADPGRASRRAWVETMQRDRAWQIALVEFWAYAARDDALRDRFAALQHRTRETLRSALQANHDDDPQSEILEFAHIALGNGLMLEGFSNPRAISLEVFERIGSALERGIRAESQAKKTSTSAERSRRSR